jgi:hypothetical protein
MLRGSKSLSCSIVLLHHENGKTYSQYNHHNLTKWWKGLRETTTCMFLGCRMQGIYKWCKRQRYKMTFRNKLHSLGQELQRGLNSYMDFCHICREQGGSLILSDRNHGPLTMDPENEERTHPCANSISQLQIINIQINWLIQYKSLFYNIHHIRT